MTYDNKSRHVIISVIIDETIKGIKPVDFTLNCVVSYWNTKLSFAASMKKLDDQHFLSNLKPCP